MKLMRSATLSVADLNRSIDTYCKWLDYGLEEQGELDDALATSLGSPNAAGWRWSLHCTSRRTVVMKAGLTSSATLGLHPV